MQTDIRIIDVGTTIDIFHSPRRNPIALFQDIHPVHSEYYYTEPYSPIYIPLLLFHCDIIEVCIVASILTTWTSLCKKYELAFWTPYGSTFVTFVSIGSRCSYPSWLVQLIVVNNFVWLGSQPSYAFQSVFISYFLFTPDSCRFQKLSNRDEPWLKWPQKSVDGHRLPRCHYDFYDGITVEGHYCYGYPGSSTVYSQFFRCHATVSLRRFFCS